MVTRKRNAGSSWESFQKVGVRGKLSFEDARLGSLGLESRQNRCLLGDQVKERGSKEGDFSAGKTSLLECSERGLGGGRTQGTFSLGGEQVNHTLSWTKPAQMPSEPAQHPPPPTPSHPPSPKPHPPSRKAAAVPGQRASSTARFVTSCSIVARTHHRVPGVSKACMQIPSE